MLAVLYHGGWMVQNHLITIGDLSTMLLYSVYAGFSISRLSYIHTHTHELLLLFHVGRQARTFDWLIMFVKPAHLIDLFVYPFVYFIEGSASLLSYPRGLFHIILF